MNFEQVFESAAVHWVISDSPPQDLEIIGKPIIGENWGIGIVRRVNTPTFYVVISLRKENEINWSIAPYQETDDPQTENGIIKLFKALQAGEIESIKRELGKPEMEDDEFREIMVSYTLVDAEDCYLYTIPSPEPTSEVHYDDLEQLVRRKDNDSLRYVEDHPTAGLTCLGCYMDFQQRRK